MSLDSIVRRSASLILVLLGLLTRPCGLAQTNPPAGWSPEKRVVGTPAVLLASGSGAPQLAAHSSNLFVVWHDFRQPPAQVYCKISRDQGANWEPETPLSPSLGLQEDPTLVVNGPTVVAAWTDQRTPIPSILVKISTNAGASWLPDISLASGSAHRRPRLVLGTGTSQILLIHERMNQEDWEVVSRTSDNGGVSWTPEMPVSPTPHFSWMPSALGGSNFYAGAWIDTRDQNEEVYFSHWTPGSPAWSPAVRITESKGSSGHPALAQLGSELRLVWPDQMDAPAFPLDAEKKLDEAYALLGLQVVPTPTNVVLVTPETRARRRNDEKLQQIQDQRGRFVSTGGDTAQLDLWLKEYDAIANRTRSITEAEQKLNQALVLIGEAVVPTVAPNPAAAPPSPPPPPSAQPAPDSYEAAQRRIEDKLQRLQVGASEWISKDGDVGKLNQLLGDFEVLMSGSTPATEEEKEAKLDDILKKTGGTYQPGGDQGLPKIYYLDAYRARVQEKIDKIQSTAPPWAQQGGDLKKIHALLTEFENANASATQSWDLYSKVSPDGGKTWSPLKRITSTPGASMWPAMLQAGEELYLAWSEGSNAQNSEIHLSTTRSGQEWSPPLPLAQSPGESSHPSLALTEGFVHVLWFDSREEAPGLYLRSRSR